MYQNDLFHGLMIFQTKNLLTLLILLGRKNNKINNKEEQSNSIQMNLRVRMGRKLFGDCQKFQ